MRRILVSLVLGVTAGLGATTAHGAIVDFRISADDYAKLAINGVQVALVDALPGGLDAGSLDLAPGLHDIELDFQNRFGSSWLQLSWKTPPETTYTVIPKDHLFSLDAAGNTINGLRADYTSSQFDDFTIYGEGPIEHRHNVFGNGMYEGVTPSIWAGTLTTGWELFQEKLTGQILIESSAVPEPNAFAVWFIGLAVSGTCWWRRRRSR